MSEVMIDIETLSTKPNALILTIGAIKFDRQGDLKELKKLDTFYIRVNRDSCEKIGLHTDKNTLKWWSEQSEESKYEVFENKERLDIKNALINLSKFLEGHRYIWSNSPNFDCVILENAYNACKLESPFKFWNYRDCRTLNDLGNVRLKDFSSSIQSHNALYDCYSQIAALKQSLKNLKLI